ncbi:hypothetical protein PABG_01369 [Paracoccidioides brasiliensis Pb03]|uniref:SHSP domain-containing protein n=2 Tax=Paracoccidioides brasiliensis TaxID=121759 RepID=C1G9M7_PARBD|nr:uncharacterized protein PADG_03963 [Paracoccidioides brasiliensis Pb18]EEH19050.2 hypothetical protein PABG_01369 [Paracoccidioides brasiliensis Pb03]EEH47879.2 hypothetical protein PADG_03963 [Paracoccidioides brasiliensis Pb18]ODH47363.1 hypothetical protein GX48_06535 [Paracoccidioides brasiliensis]
MFSRRAIGCPLKASRLRSQPTSSAYRISKFSSGAIPHIYPSATTTQSNISQARNMSFFPRLPAGDFTPLFRLLDDYESHRSGVESNSHLGGIRTFAPRFDVREAKDAYHLDGELPGINQKDIEIEFTDSQTLVIKGRSEREYSSSSNGEPGDKGQKKLHQPTVEDESSTSMTKTGGSSQEVGSVREGVKYWVSERSVGEFSRTFSFPTRVDQNAVKASLKNGILSVIIPKMSAPTSKKITIE